MKKNFPDIFNLFRGVHKNHVKANGEIMSICFQHYEMSTDRDDMCSCDDTLNRNENWVKVASLKNNFLKDNKQDIKHNPVPENDAHCLVIGNKPKTIQRLFAKNIKIVTEKNI